MQPAKQFRRAESDDCRLQNLAAMLRRSIAACNKPPPCGSGQLQRALDDRRVESPFAGRFGTRHAVDCFCKLLYRYDAHATHPLHGAGNRREKS